MSPESVTFDRAADYYDETRGFPPGEDAPIAALIREVAALTSSGRVLEVGIGTGRISLPLAKLVSSVVGIDISRAMLNRLRSKQTNEPVCVVEGDATRLPFASDTFDAAIAVHIFHLIPTWQQALSEVTRVLHPGAILIDAGGGPSSYDTLWDIWNARRPEARRAVGAGISAVETELIAQGWQRIGEPHTHEYAYRQAPQVFLDQLQRRVWSSTWRWSDDELADCLNLMQSQIHERFGDPQQEAQLQGSFTVRAFLSPPQ
jgi:SAM-dependent methyltransferase